METLVKFRDYEVAYYNTPCDKRQTKKSLYIFTNESVERGVNHRIVITGTDLNVDFENRLTTKKDTIDFYCGATWDQGPIGKHTSAEFEQWLLDNPTWSVEMQK